MCKCEEISKCDNDLCPMTNPWQQRKIVKRLIEDFDRNKKRNSAVAIICAKWWRKWQDFTS